MIPTVVGIIFFALKKFSFLFLFTIVVLAIWLRTFELGERPLHTDEAVGAAKFGQLLENGDYKYDPFEYHGPTLNYLSLIPAWIAGEYTYRDLKIETLRSIPVFFGILLVLLPVFLFYRLDYRHALVAAFLVTISPAMVFYSRYYIHEYILVFFSYLGILSYFKLSGNQSKIWSAVLGISVGMMIATKETWVISIAGFVIALFLQGGQKGLLNFIISRRFLITIGMTLIVVITFFTSFFSHYQGIVDMFATYGTYLDRAGTQELHRHPWYYYLQLLSGNSGPNYLWTEASILFLAAAGGYFLIKESNNDDMTKRLRVIVIFCLFQFVVYSALPYKTPWNLLSAYLGIIFLAGYGVTSLLKIISSQYVKLGIAVLFGLISIQLVGQTFYEYNDPADPSNPWVYGHTDGNFNQVIHTIDSVAMNDSTYIEVIFPGHDYWPFPWYLRKYHNVAYRDHVDFNSPGGEMILIAPSLEEDLVKKLYESPPPGQQFLYLYLFDSIQTLRPNVYFDGYLRYDLWDKQQSKNIEND
ncbi:MAG: flippase activity-associated protein Agl23 [Bacteroidota bacterium]